MIPVLYTTYKRPHLVAATLPLLCESDDIDIFVWANQPDDEMHDLLGRLLDLYGFTLKLSEDNVGVGGAMREFFTLYRGEIAGKVDDDTAVQPGWATQLARVAERHDLAVVQANHQSWHAKGLTFTRCHEDIVTGRVADMRQYDASTMGVPSVGGSGVIIRGDAVRSAMMNTACDEMGKDWSRAQMSVTHANQRPMSAFARDVQIVLLDRNQDGAALKTEYDYAVELRPTEAGR